MVKNSRGKSPLFILLFLILAALGSAFILSSRLRHTVTGTSYGVPKEPLFITVFSTACVALHDWQSEALVYSHYKYNVSGLLVRIDACEQKNYSYPLIWHPSYSIFRTPSFEYQNNSYGRDKYSGYNRPGGLVYWLGNDPISQKADYVIVLDPDMIVRSALHLNLMGQPVNHDFAGPGRVGGGVYEFGYGWYQKFARAEFRKLGCPFRSCVLTEQELAMFLIGPPLVFTLADLSVLARPWLDFTRLFRASEQNKGWTQEMFGLTMALAFHGNRPNVSAFLFISEPLVENEGWNLVGMANPREQITTFQFHPQLNYQVTPVLHYCQSYDVRNDASFYKYDYANHKAEALMKCTQPPFRLPLPDLRQELQLSSTTEENVLTKRKALIVNATITDLNEALDHYRKLKCCLAGFCV